MKMSTTYSLEGFLSNVFLKNCMTIKISICLVDSWNIGLVAIKITLIVKNIEGYEVEVECSYHATSDTTILAPWKC